MLVTGASRGFGAVVAEEFADAGWEVVGTARSGPPAGSPCAAWARWDVTDDDTSAVTTALGEGPLHLVVNNAGVGPPGQALEEIEVSELLAVCDTNVGGVLRATRAALPSLLLAESPLVVNISSRLGSLRHQAAGDPHRGTSYAYRVSKAAQNMATICLAGELGPKVRVWAVHPGRLATGMGRPDATDDPRLAARRLRELAGDVSRQSPRFLDLRGGEIAW